MEWFNVIEMSDCMYPHRLRLLSTHSAKEESIVCNFIRKYEMVILCLIIRVVFRANTTYICSHFSFIFLCVRVFFFVHSSVAYPTPIANTLIQLYHQLIVQRVVWSSRATDKITDYILDKNRRCRLCTPNWIWARYSSNKPWAL